MPRRFPRIAVALATCAGLAAPAIAEEPAPPGPEPAPEQPAPEPERPGVDPAYGGRPDPADGGGGYFSAPRGKDIVVKMVPDRSRRNIMGLAIAGGAGLVVSGVGVYFHLDSRAATRDVAADRFTGETWTSDRQADYDRAHRSALVAGVLYGVGGATLLGTVIAYIATEPALETLVIHPHGKGASVRWRF